MACCPIGSAVDGGLELLLITSRERGRWVIPKGNPIPFLLNYESAAREAFEEAGVEGGIATKPIGTYRYGKRRRGGGSCGDRYRLSAAGQSRGPRLARAERAPPSMVLRCLTPPRPWKRPS